LYSRGANVLADTTLEAILPWREFTPVFEIITAKCVMFEMRESLSISDG
jgi:hypothetical protein